MRRRARSAIDAGSRFTALLRTKNPIFLAVAAVVTAIAAGLTFRRATTPWASMPDADYWGNIKGLITEVGLTLDLHELLRHNNEHIVLVPKLIYAANYLLTSGSNIGLIVYSLFIGAACTALLLLLARDLLIDTPWRFLLCALLFPLAMFSTKLTHSYFLGMSGTIWLTANLFVLASAAALARAVRTQSSVWLLLSLAAALLGCADLFDGGVRAARAVGVLPCLPHRASASRQHAKATACGHRHSDCPGAWPWPRLSQSAAKPP